MSIIFIVFPELTMVLKKHCNNPITNHPNTACYQFINSTTPKYSVFAINSQLHTTASSPRLRFSRFNVYPLLSRIIFVFNIHSSDSRCRRHKGKRIHHYCFFHRGRYPQRENVSDELILDMITSNSMLTSKRRYNIAKSMDF